MSPPRSSQAHASHARDGDDDNGMNAVTNVGQPALPMPATHGQDIGPIGTVAAPAPAPVPAPAPRLPRGPEASAVALAPAAPIPAIAEPVTHELAADAPVWTEGSPGPSDATEASSDGAFRMVAEPGSSSPGSRRAPFLPSPQHYGPATSRRGGARCSQSPGQKAIHSSPCLRP